MYHLYVSGSLIITAFYFFFCSFLLSLWTINGFDNLLPLSVCSIFQSDSLLMCGKWTIHVARVCCDFKCVNCVVMADIDKNNFSFFVLKWIKLNRNCYTYWTWSINIDIETDIEIFLSLCRLISMRFWTWKMKKKKHSTLLYAYRIVDKGRMWNERWNRIIVFCDVMNLLFCSRLESHNSVLKEYTYCGSSSYGRR